MSKSEPKNAKPIIVSRTRLVRRAARRAVCITRYGEKSLDNSPVFFANSFPKSGTHLLTQVLDGFTRIGPAVNSGLPAIVTFEGDTGRQRLVSEIKNDIERLLPGDIAYGHLHAIPEITNLLSSEGMATYFIYRDPRDVVVSHAHYITEMAPGHIHSEFFRQELHNFNERLQASIVGIGNNELGTGSKTADAPPLPNICERFEPYLKWLNCQEVLKLRFEDFIDLREETVGRVLDHAVNRGFAPVVAREEAVQTLWENIDPSSSPTFRSGKVGSWRTAFDKENKRLFKDVTYDLLIRLGYEKNNDWVETND